VTTPDTSFRVHLQSLLDLARDLEDQIEALTKPIDRLNVLSGESLALGNFDEAHTLRERHRQASRQMHDLVRAVHQVVAFAADVTHAIADGYATYDQDIAGAFRGGHSAPIGPGTTQTMGGPPLERPGTSVDPAPPPQVVVTVTNNGSDPLAATVRPTTGPPPVIPGAGG
jgi:hypothetical protein